MLMESAMDVGLQLVKVVVSLAIVIGVLVIVMYGLKRLSGWARKPQANALIQVMAQHSVGLKHQLVVVKVQEQLFLLGVSPRGMHFLSPIQGTAERAPAAEHETT